MTRSPVVLNSTPLISVTDDTGTEHGGGVRGSCAVLNESRLVGRGDTSGIEVASVGTCGVVGAATATAATASVFGVAVVLMIGVDGIVAVMVE